MYGGGAAKSLELRTDQISTNRAFPHLLIHAPPFVRAPMSSQLQASSRAARTNLTYWEEPETPPPPPPAPPSVGSNVDEPIVSHSIVCCGWWCFGGKRLGGLASLEMTDDDDDEEVFYYQISKLLCVLHTSVRKRWKSVR